MQIDPGDSWGWKNMIGIRDLIKNHVRYEIGNGKSISVWYDRWNDNRPIGEYVTQRDMYDARINNTATVADLVNENGWLWPDSLTSKYPEILNIPVPTLNDSKDRVWWVTNNGLKVKFTTAQAWLDKRENWPKVEWNEVVWFKQLIPKHSFVLWLAVQSKLLTQDRMEKWHPGGRLMCSLCNTRSDSHEHLFFQCSFANKVWEIMVQNASFMNRNHDLLSGCRYIADKQVKNNFGWAVDKLILAASVYFIWQERNRRLFTGVSRNVESVISCIKDSVKTRLLALKVKKSTKSQRIASKWGLKWSSNEMFEAC